MNIIAGPKSYKLKQFKQDLFIYPTHLLAWTKISKIII